MIKHPLVQKEWKGAKWIMLLFSFIYLVGAVVLNSNINNIKIRYLLIDFMELTFMNEVYRMSSLMVPVALIGIIVLVMTLFSHDRNLNVGKFISSLPFGRKEQFTIKYAIGLITFTVPFIVFALITIIMHIRNMEWISYLYKYYEYGEIVAKQDSLRSLLIWLGIVWLLMLAVYSFLMFMQTIMGQNIIAGIVGGIIYLVPWFLAFVIPANIQLILNKYWSNNVIESMDFFFLGNPIKTFSQGTTKGRLIMENQQYYQTYEYQNLGLNIGVLLMIIMISTILAYYFIQTNDVERNGDLIMYPWVGKILIAGVTVCSLLLLPILIVIFTQIENRWLGLVSMAIGGILGYIISRRSIEMTKKHG